MPFYFNRTLATSDMGIPYDFAQFVPDAIVCNLGTNDFSTQPNPSKKQFEEGYLGLINQFRSTYPSSIIFLVCGPLIGNPCCSNVESVAQSVAGAVYIDMQDILSADQIACGHPNVSGQQLMADVVAPYIATVMNWK